MIEEKEISKDWEYQKLGEVLDIQGGSQPPKSNFIYEPKEGYVQLLQIRDFGKRGVPTYVPSKLVTKFCKKDDILIARYGASLGRIVTGLEGAYNVALAKVIDDKKLFEKRFIFYLLKTPIFQNPLKLLSRSAQNGFSKGEIAHIELPIPSPTIQQQIVSKIEELFSEVDKGIEEIKTAQQQLKVYRQAILQWAFEGKLTNENVQEGELPDGWKWVKIEHLLFDKKKGMATGPFGTMLKKDEHQKEGVAVLGIENIGEGAFQVPNKIFVTNEKAKELQNFRVKENDIIISRSGTVGEICLVPSNMVGSIISTNLIKVSLNTTVINPKFFVYLFQGGHVRQQVFTLCKGSSRAFLNQTILSSLDLPYCSPEEQQQIIQEIESRLSVCDKIEETITNSLKQAEALRQSILKKAFEGKLV